MFVNSRCHVSVLQLQMYALNVTVARRVSHRLISSTLRRRCSKRERHSSLPLAFLHLRRFRLRVNDGDTVALALCNRVTP